MTQPREPAPPTPLGGGRWVPPVAPWPPLHSRPTCTVRAAVPAGTLIALIAEELRRRRLRVTVAGDGWSVRAKPWWPVVLAVVGALVAGEGFSSPVLHVSVASEDATATALTVVVTASGVGGTGSRFVEALNAVAWRLAQGGATLTATPWERYSRFRKK